MQPWIIEQEIDLSREAPRMLLKEGTLMFAGNALAHVWRIAVKQNGVPVDLSGMAIVGEFVREDGATVRIDGTGTAQGVAQVQFVQGCYNVPGKLQGMVKASANGQEVPLGALNFTVRTGRTDLIVDPENVIPSLEELLVLVDDMEAMLAHGDKILPEAEAATASALTAADRANASADAADLITETATLAENQRQQNEQARQDNEADREDNEQARQIAETARAAAETARDDAEYARDVAEGLRDTAESARAAAEAVREDAESDRITLYDQVLEDYTSGAFDGAAATLDILPVVHEPPLTDPYVSEPPESTENARIIAIHLPSATIQYATFAINLEDGQLTMYTPPSYDGPTFAIDNETGDLEVMIHG